jgi:hypothetical protein
MVDEHRDTLWKEIAELKQAVLLLETRVDGRLGALAPRDWVHEIFNPIQQAVVRMEGSVAQLSEDAQELFDAHKEMLKEKALRERQEWEEKTPLGLVKKYAPLVGVLVGLVALFRVLGTFAEIWLEAHK